MSYATTPSGQNRTAAIAGVVAVHAALGAAVVLGLSATGVIKPVDEYMPTFEFKDPPPPEPTPPPPDQPQPKAQERQVVTPKPPRDYSNRLPNIPTVEDILPPAPPVPTPAPTGNIVFPPPPPPPPAPRPQPTFDPVSAVPKGNPGSWVTTSDYRSRWVREELTGTAGFRLQIAANGRVTGCSITRSTGHAALDEATCSLLQKRARFEPAKGRDGGPVAGTYSSAVKWQLPE